MERKRDLTNYYKATSLQEAWTLKEKFPKALFVAGGTKIEQNGETLISLAEIPQLSEIQNDCIGAMVTILRLSQDRVIGQTYPELQKVALQFAEKKATIGGSLCHHPPHGELIETLISLEAFVEIQCPKGIQLVELQNFFDMKRTPEELVTAIVLPPPK